VTANSSDFLPTISALGSYLEDHGLSGRRPEITKSSEIALGASWNLIQGGLTISEVKQAKAAYARAIALMQQRYLESITEARSAYAGVHYGIYRVRATYLAVRAGLWGMMHTRAGFKAGVQSIFDLLQAQNRLFTSERQYVRDFYQMIVDSILLKQAAGTLSPNDINQLNRFLRANGKHSATILSLPKQQAKKKQKKIRYKQDAPTRTKH